MSFKFEELESLLRYFDLDTHLMDYDGEVMTIGQPIRPQSEGKYTGIPVPDRPPRRR